MVTRNPTASRYAHLYRGVYPFLFGEAKPDFTKEDWQEDVDRRLKWGIGQSIKLGVLSRGDSVVCVEGWRGGMGHTLRRGEPWTHQGQMTSRRRGILHNSDEVRDVSHTVLAGPTEQ